MTLHHAKVRNIRNSQKRISSNIYQKTMMEQGISVEELRRLQALNISLDAVGFDYYVTKIVETQAHKRFSQF